MIVKRAKFLTLITLLATMLVMPAPLYAADVSGPMTGMPPAGGGGTCDLTAYKDSLFGTESASAGDHKAIFCGTEKFAYGRYQFLSGTLAGISAYQNAAPGCKDLTQYRRVDSKLCQGTGGFPSASCAATQEAVMDEFTLENLQWLQSNCPAAVNAVNSGKIVTGYKTGSRVGSKACAGKNTCTCPVTWSGVLAGAHIGGAQGICDTLGNGNDVDDGYTSRLFYVCEHGGLPVPDADCTPQQYETGESAQPDSTQPNGPGGPIADIEILEDPSSTFNVLSQQLKIIWVGTLQLMTSQLTAIMTEQVMAIGSFFDAKHQLETQRLLQQKHAQAHKDYHPSEQMCKIGTFSRNLANTQKRAAMTKTAMSQSSLSRMLGTGDTTTSDEFDERSKMIDYLDKYCSPEDNGGQNSVICNNEDKTLMNADINYTQTIDMPLTLPLNMLDEDVKPEEQTLFALLDNLVMHDVFPWKSKDAIDQVRFREPYQEMRSLIAMRSVVQNSFSHILSEKTESPSETDESAGPFIKALMVEMGIPPSEVDDVVGENPSYYAQMEVLTKKIYQHPQFISNLYDKPANVKRMKAALTAIKLMQDRDIHNALQRREMLMSIFLELQLRQEQMEMMTTDIPAAIINAQPLPTLPPAGSGEGF